MMKNKTYINLMYSMTTILHWIILGTLAWVTGIALGYLLFYP
mgnify:CR=1 FL=1